MSKSKKHTMTRLIVRFPEPLYLALRAEAEATSIPMAILIRQLVARWAKTRAMEKAEAA